VNRCPLCPHVRPRVLATGPVPCRFLFLGEAPSTKEDELGYPFCGKTGSELERVYLPIALLHRDSVYIMNAAQCSKADYDNPTTLEAQSCCNMFLGPALMKVQPQIVIPMGAVACSVFGEIKDLGTQHGVPLVGSYGGWSGVLFPTYHPSAGIHSPGFMIPLMSDFKRLGELARELEVYT
jgi:uracil-DNA glycosylase